MDPYHVHLTEQRNFYSSSPLFIFPEDTLGSMSPISVGLPQGLFSSIPSTPVNLNSQGVYQVALQRFSSSNQTIGSKSSQPLASFSSVQLIDLTQDEKQTASTIYQWIKNPSSLANASTQVCQLYLQSLVGSLDPSVIGKIFQHLIEQGWLKELKSSFNHAILPYPLNREGQIISADLPVELYKNIQSAIYFFNFLKESPDYLIQAFEQGQTWVQDLFFLIWNSPLRIEGMPLFFKFLIAKYMQFRRWAKQDFIQLLPTDQFTSPYAASFCQFVFEFCQYYPLTCFIHMADPYFNKVLTTFSPSPIPFSDFLIKWFGDTYTNVKYLSYISIYDQSRQMQNFSLLPFDWLDSDLKDLMQGEQVLHPTLLQVYVAGHSKQLKDVVEQLLEQWGWEKKTECVEKAKKLTRLYFACCLYENQKIISQEQSTNRIQLIKNQGDKLKHPLFREYFTQLFSTLSLLPTITIQKAALPKTVVNGHVEIIPIEIQNALTRGQKLPTPAQKEVPNVTVVKPIAAPYSKPIKHVALPSTFSFIDETSKVKQKVEQLTMPPKKNFKRRVIRKKAPS